MRQTAVPLASLRKKLTLVRGKIFSVVTRAANLIYEGIQLKGAGTEARLARKYGNRENNREPRWTSGGMKVVLTVCKHCLTFPSSPIFT